MQKREKCSEGPNPDMSAPTICIPRKTNARKASSILEIHVQAISSVPLSAFVAMVVNSPRYRMRRRAKASPCAKPIEEQSAELILAHYLWSLARVDCSCATPIVTQIPFVV